MVWFCACSALVVVNLVIWYLPTAMWWARHVCIHQVNPTYVLYFLWSTYALAFINFSRMNFFLVCMSNEAVKTRILSPNFFQKDRNILPNTITKTTIWERKVTNIKKQFILICNAHTYILGLLVLAYPPLIRGRRGRKVLIPLIREIKAKTNTPITCTPSVPIGY